jgi:hypothetical protein
LRCDRFANWRCLRAPIDRRSFIEDRLRPQAVSDRLHISARKLPLPLLGCQHAVIAVALDARGWDQYSQPLDQFQRCQTQLRAAIGLGLSKR